MVDIAFWVAVGAFVGWNFPQPAYAKWIQKKVVDMVKGFGNKTK